MPDVVSLAAQILGQPFEQSTIERLSAEKPFLKEKIGATFASQQCNRMLLNT